MKTSLIKILTTTLLFCCITISYSQTAHKGCGTVLSKETELLIAQELLPTHQLRLPTDGPSKLAITAHIIRRSDGTGGLTESQLVTALEKVNNFYQNAGLEFFFFGEINFVDEDDFFDFKTDSEQALANERDVPNTINIYFANSVLSGSDPLCGYAYFPGNPDRILMDNSCTLNGTTLSHEIGHYLTLYHTHGKTNNGTTDELVNGSNCDEAGDDVCDTPADPNLTGKVNSSCQYTGNLRDSNGDLYQPNPENIMSYAPQSCRRLFTSGQYDRAFSGYISFRSYLAQKNYSANFKSDQNQTCVGDELNFVNSSLGSYENIAWRFPGGSPETATSENPSVVYTAPGQYDVELTVFGDDGGTDVKLLKNAINVIDVESSDINSALYDFEVSDISEFQTHSPGDSIKYSIETVGFESEQSLSFQFYRNNNVRSSDYVLLEPLTNPGQMDYIISFDYAFTYYSDGTSERIDNVNVLSRGCGPWMQAWTANGKEHSTTSSKSGAFEPDNEEWAHAEAYVPIDANSNFIQLAIEANNNNGNNFYIDNIEVTYATGIVIRNIETTNEQCAGDSDGIIEIKASFNGNEISYSLDGATYQSSGIFTGLNAGSYEVFIKSGEQVISRDVSVSVTSQKPAKPTILFSNNELRLLSSAFEIEWYYNDELIDNTGATKIPYAGSGDYYVVVRNETGCENISDIFSVLSLNNQFQGVSMYPNPSKGRLFINAQAEIKITITDLTGQTFFHDKISKGESSLNLTRLKDGVYLINMTINNEVKIKKIVISR